MAAEVKFPVLPYKEWRVYMPVADVGVAHMLQRRGARIALHIADANIAFFTGGADIMPVLYGETPIEGTKFNLKRDLEEVRTFKTLNARIPKVGICRGAQLLNVLCGGSLWQDVNNHGKSHKALSYHDGHKEIEVTSTHHQMMIPNYALGYEFLVARESTEKRGERRGKASPDAKSEDFYDDCEGVYYTDFNSLCFQPHPEYGHKQTEAYFFHMLEELLDWRHYYRQKEAAEKIAAKRIG
jgi:GMP synthase-like glutamine amidotransferase